MAARRSKSVRKWRRSVPQQGGGADIPAPERKHDRATAVGIRLAGWMFCPRVPQRSPDARGEFRPRRLGVSVHPARPPLQWFQKVDHDQLLRESVRHLFEGVASTRRVYRRKGPFEIRNWSRSFDLQRPAPASASKSIRTDFNDRESSRAIGCETTRCPFRLASSRSACRISVTGQPFRLRSDRCFAHKYGDDTKEKP